MILFIAESLSERQHLVSVRSCFHPLQQLDRTLQHKEINQFAKVTQRVSDSLQIRPQEPLDPWMPRVSHMTNREFSPFYRLQMDSPLLIFYLCLYFQSPKELFFLTFLPWGDQISFWFPVNAKTPCPPQLGFIHLGWVCEWQEESEMALQCPAHTGKGKMAIQRLANSEQKSQALYSGHSKCASEAGEERMRTRLFCQEKVSFCFPLSLFLYQCYFSQSPGYRKHIPSLLSPMSSLPTGEKEAVSWACVLCTPRKLGYLSCKGNKQQQTHPQNLFNKKF